MIALGGLRLSQVHDGRCLPAPTTRRPGRASRPTRCAQPQPLEKYRLPTFTALCRNFAASKCSPIRCNSCTAPLKQAVYGTAQRTLRQPVFWTRAAAHQPGLNRSACLTQCVACCRTDPAARGSRCSLSPRRVLHARFLHFCEDSFHGPSAFEPRNFRLFCVVNSLVSSGLLTFICHRRSLSLS